LLTPPLNVVVLINTAEALPPNSVGNGPVNATAHPDADQAEFRPSRQHIDPHAPLR
jgi:hypothetical protein